MNPLVRGIRSRLRPKSMPLNVVNDRDGSSRILLTDPAGSTAEVLLLPLFSSSYSIFGSSEISPCEKLDFAHTIMDFEKI